MDVRCPGCKRPVTISADLAATDVLCPHCSRRLVKAGSAPRVEGRKRNDLLTDLLTEARRLDAANPRRMRRSSGAPPARDESEEGQAASATRARQVKIGAAIVLLFLALGATAGTYIWTNIRTNDARVALDRINADKQPLMDRLKVADDLRKAKNYAKASDAYAAVVAQSNSLLRQLTAGTRGLRPGKLAEEAEVVHADLKGCLDRATEALASAEVSNGAKGLVQDDDGSWVTPEEKQQRFAARMAAEGRTLVNGKWLTEAEIHEAKGDVIYNGQWYTKAERARLMAMAQRTQRVRPAAAPVPDVSAAASSDAERFDPTLPAWVVDDFQEAGYSWTNVHWNNVNPIGLSLEQRGSANELCIALSGGKFDKHAIVRPLNVDLSSRSKLVLDIFNDCPEPVRVAIAFDTSASPPFYESHSTMVGVKAKRAVTFDLTAGDFKSEATHWAHATGIKNREKTSWLYLLIYYDKPGKLYLDNIKLLSGK